MDLIRPIPGHDGFYADHESNVWSTAWGKWKKLSQSDNGRGYLRVRPGTKTVSVHRLVCMAYNEEAASKEVRHLDGNKRNNTPSNLKWGSSKENASDRRLHGTESAAWVSKKYTTKTICLRGHDRLLNKVKNRRECRECKRFLDKRYYRKGLTDQQKLAKAMRLISKAHRLIREVNEK